MSNYNNVTTDEIKLNIKRLLAKAEPLRLSINKQCDELEKYYVELIELDKELTKRENAG